MAKRTTKHPVSNDKSPSQDVEDAQIVDDSTSHTQENDSPVSPPEPSETRYDSPQSDPFELTERFKEPSEPLESGDPIEVSAQEGETATPQTGDVDVNEPEAPNQPLDSAASEDQPLADPSKDPDRDPFEDNPVADLIQIEEDTAPKPEPQPAPYVAPSPPPTVVQQKAGVSGIIGGAIAAVLGFGLAQVVPNGWPVDLGTEELRAQIAAQDGTITDLKGQIESLQTELGSFAKSTDLTGLGSSVETQIADVASGTENLQSQLSSLQSQLDQNLLRLDALERRPIAESSDEAVAAAVETYNREVAALRSDIAAQLEETKALINDSAAKAAEAEVQAKIAAEARALLDVRTALETGATFAEPLQAIASVEAPAELAGLAESGVATLAELTESLPDLARQALEESRTAQEGDSASDRLGTFFERQLGLRSLAPREGDDPDAVLSRIEAAIAAGDLETVLQDAQALPEPALAVLQEWLAQVETRQTALQAAAALAQSLNSN